MEAPPARPRLGVLVPCYDEARVVERRLANLAACGWPERTPWGGVHRVVVVDDGSRDGTRALAAAAAARFDVPGVSVEVVPNDVRPGKPGALRTGIALMGTSVDVIVLTDADVLFAPDALETVAAAFADDERLVMATGAQRFVRTLPADGRVDEARASVLEPADDLFDRATSRVRALESRAGRSFSVHGQLLAWRAELGLLPRLGRAADDLDLMLQARGVRTRAGRGRIERLARARFFERKTPAGPDAQAQALRRARAWFQAFADARELPPSPDLLGRAQLAFYRHAPALAPRAGLVAALAAPLLLGASAGLPAGLLCGAPELAGLAAPPGRGLLRGLRLMERARRLERVAPLPERWEMARESQA